VNGMGKRVRLARRGRVVAGVVLALAVATVAGCGGSDDASDTASGTEAAASGTQGLQSVKLMLPAPAGINFLGYHVARAKYWKEQGLDVDAIATDGSSVVAQQLVSGNEKFGVLGAASLYLADKKGADLRGIATLTHDDVARLSVPDDSDITDVTALDGKAIGIPAAGDGSVPIVEAVLAQAGLKPIDDVELPVVGAGGPAVVQALKSGRIAAYAHGQSDIPGIEIKGKTPLRSIMPEAFVGLPGNVLGVSQKTLDDPADRELAIKLARGWLQAGQFIAAHTDEALKIGCEAVPEDCQDMAVAELQAELSSQTQNPLVADAPGTTPEDKAETLIKAVAGDVTMPIGDALPNTYIDQIDAKLEG
jgi:NitT/TauT family transport system substrate-binding protein